MIKDFLKGVYIGLGILFVFSLLGMVYAVGFHAANEILPGSFQSGNFSFNGNVGIGNNYYREKLDISGDIYIDGANENSSLKLGGTDYLWELTRDWVDNGNFKIHYNQGNLDALVINRNGNVGIGTNNPRNTLEINGDLQVRAPQLGYTNGGVGFGVVASRYAYSGGNFTRKIVFDIEGTDGANGVYLVSGNGRSNGFQRSFTGIVTFAKGYTNPLVATYTQISGDYTPTLTEITANSGYANTFELATIEGNGGAQTVTVIQLTGTYRNNRINITW